MQLKDYTVPQLPLLTTDDWENNLILSLGVTEVNIQHVPSIHQATVAAMTSIAELKAFLCGILVMI